MKKMEVAELFRRKISWKGWILFGSILCVLVLLFLWRGDGLQKMLRLSDEGDILSGSGRPSGVENSLKLSMNLN